MCAVSLTYALVSLKLFVYGLEKINATSLNLKLLVHWLEKIEARTGCQNLVIHNRTMCHASSSRITAYRTFSFMMSFMMWIHKAQFHITQHVQIMRIKLLMLYVQITWVKPSMMPIIVSPVQKSTQLYGLIFSMGKNYMVGVGLLCLVEGFSFLNVPARSSQSLAHIYFKVSSSCLIFIHTFIHSFTNNLPL